MSKSTIEERLARAQRVGEFMQAHGLAFVKCTPEEQLAFRKDYLAMLEDGDFFSAERITPWDTEFTYHQAELHSDYDKEFLKDNIAHVEEVLGRMFREDTCQCDPCKRRRGELVDDDVVEARKEFGESKGNTLVIKFEDYSFTDKVEDAPVKESNADYSYMSKERAKEIEAMMPIVESVGTFFEKYGTRGYLATEIEKAEFITNYKKLLENSVFYYITNETDDGTTHTQDWGCVDALSNDDSAMEQCKEQLNDYDNMIDRMFSNKNSFADIIRNTMAEMGLDGVVNDSIR